MLNSNSSNNFNFKCSNSSNNNSNNSNSSNTKELHRKPTRHHQDSSHNNLSKQLLNLQPLLLVNELASLLFLTSILRCCRNCSIYKQQANLVAPHKHLPHQPPSSLHH